MNLTDIANACGTDKGTHQGYMPLYERYLPGPDAPITLVELGVYRGGSLRLWANYFRNDNTQIWGIDISLDLYPGMMDPRVKAVEGDQADSGFAQVISASRYVDVLVDDASHEGPKTAESFEVWWQTIRPGGLYVIEDTHCSYNTDHYRTAGKPGTPYTMMEFVKLLADDVNWGIHGYNRFTPMFKDVAFVHFYPGIVFIGKKEA